MYNKYQNDYAKSSRITITRCDISTNRQIVQNSVKFVTISNPLTHIGQLVTNTIGSSQNISQL